MRKFEHYTESIYYQLEQTAKYCKYLGLQIFQKLNIKITPDEFATMDVIMQNNGICQRELAKLILKDRPNTGRILNSLEGFGYVERYADTKNNRLVKRVRLTQDGEKIVDNITKILEKYFDKLPQILSEKERQNLMTSIVAFRLLLEKEVEMKI